ncbi:MAG: hypothetical protein JNJ56_06680 [Ignavibacteria bacterium]|nr:hypothetical protein [Ignavibacteria bacterium]
MDLKTLQLKLLDILKEKHIPSDEDEKYIKDVLSSKNLTVLKDIIYFWRSDELARYCNFTSAYLKKINAFDDKVKEYYRVHNTSGYIEVLGKEFLNYLKSDIDKLTVFVAGFELSMIEVNSGSENDFFIETCYEPSDVFNFVYSDSEYPSEKKEKFIVRVSSELENNFTVINTN